MGGLIFGMHNQRPVAVRVGATGAIMINIAERAYTTSALLTDVTAITTGPGVAAPNVGRRLFVLNGATTSGVGSATASVDCSIDGVAWEQDVLILLLPLTTTQAAVSNFIDNPWPFHRARLTAISGAGAVVSTRMIL